MVITQNIDNLHRKAGYEKIIEIHGNYGEFKCIGCGHKTDVSNVFDKISKGDVPYCEKCNSAMKPNVVFSVKR